MLSSLDFDPQALPHETFSPSLGLTHDALGNRTRMVENRLNEDGATETTVFDYIYDNANQLLSIDSSDGGFTEFAYDNNGNMAEEVIWKAPKGKGKDAPSLDENRAYFYDFDDRLCSPSSVI